MNSETTHAFNPFPGLRPFSTDEDYLFFGREEQTNELLALLREHRFLAVVGTSGSGKSSLVRAGLLPALHGGTMAQAGSSWEVLLLRPGGHPVANLARSLLDAELYDPDDPESLPRIIATLNRSRLGLVEAVRQSDFPSGTNLLVVVDQFEELFRFRQSGIAGQEAASAFVKLLLAASEQSELPIYIAITMRSDYLGECAQIPGLAEAVNDGEYLIPRLSREQRRAAIEKPVAVGGGTIAHRLVQKLLNDVGDDADQLPVLQHALMRIWDFWCEDQQDDQPLDLKHYERAGGLQEALSRHADEVYEELSSDRLRTITQRLFKALTERGTDNRGIRRPTRLERLCAIIDASELEVTTVIDAFRRPGRTFLMPMSDVELTPHTVVDISHESLMRVWKRLDEWVDQESQSARIYRRVAETAALHAEGKAGLFHDPDLQIALSWRKASQPTEAWAARYHAGFVQAMDFLDTSQQAAEVEQREREAARQRELEQARKLAEAERLRAEEQQRSASRLKVLIAAVGVVAVVAGIASIVAMIAGYQARQNALRAELAEDQAVLDAKAAETARNQAVLSRQDAEQQRELARRGLYVAQINAAQRVLENPAGASQASRMLAELRPKPGETDLRGWEWYYLNLPQQLTSRSIQGRSVLLCVAYSPPDGKKVAFGGGNGELVAWDLERNRELLTLIGHQNFVIDVAWSPDGRRIASSDTSGRVKLWDAETGLELRDFSVHTNATLLSWKPDGSQLATSAFDNVVRIWDTATGTQTQQFAKEPGGAGCEWSPDGLYLAAVNGGDKITVWESLAGEEVITFDGHRNHVRQLAWSPDGTRIVSGDIGGLAMIWDTRTGERVGRPLRGHTATIHRVQWSPDGDSILTVAADNTAHVFDAETQRSMRTLRGHAGSVFGAAWHPDNRHVATAGVDSRIILWDLQQEEQSDQVWGNHPDAVDDVTWSPDGSRFAVAGRDQTVAVWDFKLHEKVADLTGHQSPVISLAWSPDGNWLASGDEGNSIRIWDVRSTELRTILSGNGGSVSELGWSSDNRSLAAAVGNEVCIWDAGNWDRPARRVLKGHEGTVNSVAWSPDGRLLASGGAERRAEGDETRPNVRIWNVASGEQLEGLFGESESINCLAWSPSGQHLASAGTVMGTVGVDANIRVWDMATREQTTIMWDHTAPFTSVHWRHDGSRLVSASEDGSIRVWDPQQGEELLKFTGTSPVNGVAWSPRGLRILSGDATGKIQLLDAYPGYERDCSEVVVAELNTRIVRTGATRDTHLARARVHARHGRWSEAESDFLAATDLLSENTSTTDWFFTPWWVLGPYSRKDPDVFPTGSPPDPFAHAGTGKADSEGPTAVYWRPAFPTEEHGFDLREYFDSTEDISCYLYSRVYSPREQSVGLLQGSDDTHQVWLNGQNVRKDSWNGMAVLDSQIDQVTLQQGWNTMLVKVTNTWGAYKLYVRLSTDSLDLARAYDRSGEFNLALDHWNRLLESEPRSVPLLLRRSRSAEQAGEIELAVADLTTLLDALPDNGPLLRKRAELLQQLQRWDEAVAAYQHLVRVQPDDWQLRMELGKIEGRALERTLISPNAEWRWLHLSRGDDPVSSDGEFHRSFFHSDYDDSSWEVGRDSPGPGGGFGLDDSSRVNMTAPPPNTITAAYFRHKFSTDTPYQQLSLQVRRQDGVIVYLDGNEVGRDNIDFELPEAFELRATRQDGSNDLRVVPLQGELAAGEHVLTISLHNARRQNSKLRIGEISLHGRPLEIDTPAPLDHPAELLGRGLTFEELGLGEFADADLAAALGLVSDDPVGLSKLLTFVIAGNIPKLVEQLIERGADVNVRDSNGSSPLHLAARLGQVEMVKFLLARQADVNATDNAGNTPLHEIISTFPSKNDKDILPAARCAIVRALLQQGPDLTIQNREALTPLENGQRPQKRMLSLAEVQVFRQDRNIASQGEARQSSVAFGGLPERAIDGNTSGDYMADRSVTHTKEDEIDPWWEVDLGAEQQVDRIVIWDRTPDQYSTYRHRLQNYIVQLMDNSRKVVWKVHMAEDPEPSHEHRIDAVGRYIRITAPSTEEGLWWESGTPGYYRWEADRLIAGGRLEDAIQMLTKAIDQVPDDPQLCLQRAVQCGRLKRWDQALADMKHVIELEPDQDFHYLRAAPLFLVTGDTEGYRRLCRDMLERFQNTEVPLVADKIAKSCLLLPDGVDDLQRVVSLASKAVADDPTSGFGPYLQALHALTACRLGEYQTAILTIQENLPHVGNRRHLLEFNNAVLALAYTGADKPEQAREVVDELGATLDAALAGSDVPSWHDLLISQILRQEVVRLLADSSAAGDQ